MEGLDMKKIYRFFFAAVAIASVASCSEQLDSLDNAGEGTVELVNMTFKAATDVAEDVESKTYGAGRNVYWESGDEITVFSIGDKVVKEGFKTTSVAEDKTWAQFSGLADPDAETYYAVYPHAEGNTYADGIFNATIPSEQVGRPNGFGSGTNVAVAVSTEGTDGTGMLQFKNLSAVIYFKFATAEDAANTKSVTLKARKSEDDAATPEFWGLTGDVKFTLDDNNLPVAQEGTVDHVTLLPPDGGFVSGINYIIPVCPVGKCKGMQIIFTDQNDVTYEKNNNTDFKLQRNIMFNNGGVPEPYYPPLADSFSIEIDFTKGWPFTPMCVDKDNQTDAGDAYTYNYEYEYQGVNYSLPVEFGIWKGTGIDTPYYSYENNKLCFHSYYNASKNNSVASIKIPVLKDRYLVKVIIVHDSSKSKRFTFNVGFPTGSPNYTQSYVAANTECVMEFPFSKSGSPSTPSPVLGQVYSIRTRDIDTDVVRMEFFYSKDNPYPAE